MTKSTKLYKIYYLFLGLLLLGQAFITVLKLGQTVRYQHRISQLQQQKTKLLNRQQEIEGELNLTSSLALNQAEVGQEYTQIDSPLQLTADQVLALK